ncbi:MAG: rhomboid family intramembrane serine protease, partial [Pseudomonadota bacterium]
VGASGAMAGVIGGFTVRHPGARVILLGPFFIPFRLPALLFSSFWLLFQIVPGLMALGQPDALGGIAWWAHIGGFVAGALLIFFFGETTARRNAGTGERAATIEIGDERPRVIRVRGGRSAPTPAGAPRPAAHGPVVLTQSASTQPGPTRARPVSGRIGRGSVPRSG